MRDELPATDLRLAGTLCFRQIINTFVICAEGADANEKQVPGDERQIYIYITLVYIKVDEGENTRTAALIFDVLEYAFNGFSVQVIYRSRKGRLMRILKINI